MTKFANSAEIKYAHSILLKNKPEYEQDKIDIIECNESRDIKACPGSGKTTTLLAKLIILANRMPLPNNQGICVLTHTNVAIEEIKSKLGNKVDVLFSYPNYFGTIQSFVDKYLAIPYYTQYWNNKIRRIDDETASVYASKIFYTKSFNEKKCLYRQVIDRIPTVTLSSSEKTKIITNLMFNLIKEIWIEFDLSNQPIFYRKYGDVRAFATDRSTDTYKIINDTRLSIFSQGELMYKDAYSLGLAGINKNPKLKRAFSSRFKYLFIDEMQDTDKLQIDILDKIFDREKTVIQRFGDHHQAIYNKVEINNIWTPINPLPLDCSKRFGENIAKILRSVCVENNNSLMPNSDISSIKPILIIYDDPKTVLPKFVLLLKERNINGESILNIANEERLKDPMKRNNIKAIGWVGTDRDDVRTIKSYFEPFSKNTHKKDRVNYESLKSFLCKKEHTRIKDYSNVIIRAILHILSLTNESKNEVNGRLRDHTKTSFTEKYLNENPEQYINFRINLAKWSKNIHNCETSFCNITINEIRTFLKTDLSTIFGYNATNSLIESFINNDDAIILTDGQIEHNNLYEVDDIMIDIGTIHSAKGETHAATLYLETSYQGKCESQRICDQLKGITYSGTGTRCKETLKMAYVGMSRPKYMLCMAIHNTNFTFNCDDLRNFWDVENA